MENAVAPQKVYFESLDSLRGIAAIAVAWFHFWPNWGGYLAVDFFLVLSGFVLSHSYLYGKQLDFRQFLIRRLARLYPMHMYCLIIYIIVVAMLGLWPNYSDGNMLTLLQQITLTQNIGLSTGGLSWNIPGWSISVEFWINILFFVLISKKTKNIWLIFTSILCLSLIFINTGHLDTNFLNYYIVINSGMIRGIGSFFIGILAYRAWKHINPYKFRSEKYLFSCIELMSLAAIIFILFWRDTKSSYLDFAMPVASSLVVIVFGQEKGLVSHFFKLLKYIGTISYSIYLNQIVVLLVLYKLLWQTEIYGYRINPLMFLAIYTLALLIYSHLTYKFIETPLRHKFKNWLTNLNQTATNEAVEINLN